MADQSFTDALNEQISNEFAASQQYVGAAVYYDAETLPQLAAFFYRQAVEERNHAMIMVQYLLDTDEEVRIPDIRSQQTRYDDVSGPVKMALEQEKRVSDEIYALFKLAREAGDFRAVARRVGLGRLGVLERGAGLVLEAESRLELARRDRPQEAPAPHRFGQV